MADIYLHHRKDKRLYASVYRLETVIFSFLSLGNLSNNDGDANEDSKKAIGLGWHKNNSARASRFFVHFCAVVTGFLISRFMEDAEDGNTRRQTHEKIANLLQTRRVGIAAMKYYEIWNSLNPILGWSFRWRCRFNCKTGSKGLKKVWTQESSHWYVEYDRAGEFGPE